MFFFREICENFMPSLLFNGNILANNIVHQLNRSVCSPVIVHPWIFFLDAYHLFIVYRLLVNECFLFYLYITVCPYRNIFLWLGKTCIKHKCLFICAVYSYHNTNIAIFYKMYSTSPLWCFMSLLFIFDFYLVHT